MFSRCDVRIALAAGAAAALVLLAGCATPQAGPAPPPAQPAAAAPVTSAPALSLDIPIATLAADPRAKAVLERDLPGLLERPEYPMFSTLSLNTLAGLSNGKISSSTLAKLQSDLRNAGTTAPTP